MPKCDRIPGVISITEPIRSFKDDIAFCGARSGASRKTPGRMWKTVWRGAKIGPFFKAAVSVRVGLRSGPCHWYENALYAAPLCLLSVRFFSLHYSIIVPVMRTLCVFHSDTLCFASLYSISELLTDRPYLCTMWPPLRTQKLSVCICTSKQNPSSICLDFTTSRTENVFINYFYTCPIQISYSLLRLALIHCYEFFNVTTCRRCRHPNTMLHENCCLNTRSL